MNKMTRDRVQSILDQVELRGILSDRRLRLTEKGDGLNLQVVYPEHDVVTGQLQDQHSRKWYVSPFATVSEVVRTVQKALKCSMEHVVDEHMLFRGVRVFSPHYDVEALANLPEAYRGDARTPPQAQPVRTGGTGGPCVRCERLTSRKVAVSTYGDPWKNGDWLCEDCFFSEYPSMSIEEMDESYG